MEKELDLMPIELFGTLVYTYDEGKLLMAKIVKYSKENKTYTLYVVVGKLKGKKIIGSLEVINNNWTRLTPDAIMSINAVEHDGLKDVIVLLFPTKDRTGIPAVVCRQNCVDVFCYDPNSPHITVGCSITPTTCPVGLDYESFMFADGDTIASTYVAVYNTDIVEGILDGIRVTKYDSILRTNADKFEKHPRMLQNARSIGWCSSLAELLKFNSFQADIYRTFGIVEVPYSLRDKDLVPMDAMADIIVNECNEVPSAIYIYRYDKTVNLDSIQRKYIMCTAELSDREADDTGIYIVGYDVDESITIADYKYGGKENLNQKLADMGFS